MIIPNKFNIDSMLESIIKTLFKIPQFFSIMPIEVLLGNSDIILYLVVMSIPKPLSSVSHYIHGFMLLVFKNPGKSFYRMSLKLDLFNCFLVIILRFLNVGENAVCQFHPIIGDGRFSQLVKVVSTKFLHYKGNVPSLLHM